MSAVLKQGAAAFSVFLQDPPNGVLARPLNVLVFDDEPAVTRMFCRLLSQRGCRVVSTTDGQHAVDVHAQALQDGRPMDLLFLDFHVRTGLTGEDVFLATHQADPRALAVLCSGAQEPHELKRLAAQGFFAHLPKPFELEALQEVLHVAALHVASLPASLPLPLHGAHLPGPAGR